MIGKTIAIDNTRFIFATNFSGDPTKDRFGDARRKANMEALVLSRLTSTDDWKGVERYVFCVMRSSSDSREKYYGRDY